MVSMVQLLVDVVIKVVMASVSSGSKLISHMTFMIQGIGSIVSHDQRWQIANCILRELHKGTTVSEIYKDTNRQLTSLMSTE